MYQTPLLKIITQVENTSQEANNLVRNFSVLSTSFVDTETIETSNSIAVSIEDKAKDTRQHVPRTRANPKVLSDKKLDMKNLKDAFSPTIQDIDVSPLSQMRIYPKGTIMESN